MRIAMLTYSVKPRGGVVHALNLAESLQSLGHEVHVYALAKDKSAQFFRKLRVDATIYTYIPYSSDNRYSAEISNPESIVAYNVERMIEAYRKNIPHDYDVYHTQDCVGAVALHRMKKEGLCAPTVRTVHHIDIFNENRLKAFHEQSIHACDVRLVVSKYWQRYVSEHYGIKAEITYNGIDVERFGNAAKGRTVRKKLGIGSRPVILFVGGLEPRKGLEYLFFAMEHILKKYEDAVLVAVARSGLIDRGENKWFAQLAERLGISEHVRIFDFVPEEEIPSFYGMADIYAMPSRMEGWGIGLMEAMASGKPVIATRVGGIPELVRHRKNGLLIAPCDINALARGICSLLSSARMRNRLGSNGRAYVKRFTWKGTAEKCVRIYKNAVAEYGGLNGDA